MRDKRKKRVFLYHYTTLKKISTFDSQVKTAKRLKISENTVKRYIEHGTLIADECFITDIERERIDFE